MNHSGNQLSDYRQLSFIPKYYFFHLDHPPFSWVDSGNFHPPPSLHQESCHGRYFAEHACSLKASPQEGLIELRPHLWPKYAASQSDCLRRHRAHLGSSGCVSFKITHITLESHLVRQGSGSPESRQRHFVPPVCVLFNFILQLSGRDLAGSFSGSKET